MDDDFDVVLVDERNAVVPPPRRPPAMMRPVARPWPPQPVRYPQQYPQQFAPTFPRQRPMIIVQRQPSFLAQFDFGEVVEKGVTLLAAIQPLPEAPTVTGSPGKDVGNMILYQEALGTHAKANERFRAFGDVFAQVVKALVKNAQQPRGFQLGG